jgi:hypothetical protein
MRRDRPERQFDRPDDDLLASLRVALRPEPLPATLSERIRADLDRRCVAARRSGLRAVHVVWAAVAACLAVAVLLPPRTAPRAPDSFAPVSLTSDEAAEVVAAYAMLSWDSPADYTLDALDTSLDRLERALRREAGSMTLLPWSNDDDWDVPAATDENPTQSRAPDGGLCFAGGTCKSNG